MAEKMKRKIMIRGTGNTCIFFHNSCLSQQVLEGKHPSSKKVMFLYYINISLKGSIKKNGLGTLESKAICAYSKPNRCFLTASAAPITGENNGLHYLNFLKNESKEATNA